MYEGPGIYRHFKGGEYTVTGDAEDTETGVTYVHYISFKNNKSWLRELSNFNDIVTVDGKDVNRFEKVRVVEGGIL